MKRTKGLSLIVIDYLQLMRPATGTRPENRVLEIAQLTQGLKAIAKELAVPVLALSQLSRAVESREDKRPQLADLRESGTIEQDADVVMFIYRDEYYLEQRMPKIAAFDNEDKFQSAMDEWKRQMDRVHNQTDLIIAKQRHGPTGTIQLFFEAEFTRFADIDLVHRDHGLRPLTAHAGAVLEIDLGAIVANWQLLRSLHPSGPVAGVVKADGYGLGARHVTRALYAAGCRHFFVALLDEALAIRELAPDALLAVLGGLIPGSEPDYLACNIVPVLGSLAEVDAWTNAARAAGRRLPAILHVDTGMARLGLDQRELRVLQQDHARLDGIALGYVMTHLVASEVRDDPLNELQVQRFAAACAGLPPAPRSFANSSGIFLGPRWASDLARPGAALYGINPVPGRAATRCTCRSGCARASWRSARPRQGTASATTPPGARSGEAASPRPESATPMGCTAACRAKAAPSLTAPRCRW